MNEREFNSQLWTGRDIYRNVTGNFLGMFAWFFGYSEVIQTSVYGFAFWPTKRAVGFARYRFIFKKIVLETAAERYHVG